MPPSIIISNSTITCNSSLTCMSSFTNGCEINQPYAFYLNEFWKVILCIVLIVFLFFLAVMSVFWRPLQRRQRRRTLRGFSLSLLAWTIITLPLRYTLHTFFNNYINLCILVWQMTSTQLQLIDNTALCNLQDLLNWQIFCYVICYFCAVVISPVQ